MWSMFSQFQTRGGPGASRAERGGVRLAQVAGLELLATLRQTVFLDEPVPEHRDYIFIDWTNTYVTCVMYVFI